jgi:hypothetical protein
VNTEGVHPIQRSFVKAVAVQRGLRTVHVKATEWDADLIEDSVQFSVKRGRFGAGPCGARTQAVGHSQSIGCSL